MSDSGLKSREFEYWDDEPVDPDVALITNYLAHELTPGQTAEVRHRLVEDDEFFEKVAPYIRTWTMPVSFRALLARHQKAVTDRVAAAPQKPAREPAFAYAWERTDRRTHFFRRPEMMLRIAGIVAVFASGSGYAYLRFASEHRTVVEVDRGAPITGMWRAQGVEAPQAEGKTVVLRNGTRVVLKPGSHLDTVYGLIGGFGARTTLEGEASFDVSTGERFVDVFTSAGRVLLTPGIYAVRCEKGCAAMLVTVIAGGASIRSDSARTSVSLQPGEYGRMRRGGLPEKVGADAADGYPQPEVRMNLKSAPSKSK